MAKFARKDVRIAVDGGPVEVEVVCGFAHHIRFECELFDDKGNNPQPIVTASNIETEPPPFHLNVVPLQLLGRFLVIRADLSNLGTTNNFLVEAIFRQKNQVVDRIAVQDTFADVVAVTLVARFQ